MGDIGVLSRIDMESGLAEDGDDEFRGFVTVRATAEDGSVLVGQLPPDEAREMAMNWLAAAEAADQDRIVMSMLTQNVGLAPEVAVNFIAKMRERREL